MLCFCLSTCSLYCSMPDSLCFVSLPLFQLCCTVDCKRMIPSQMHVLMLYALKKYISPLPIRGHRNLEAVVLSCHLQVDYKSPHLFHQLRLLYELFELVFMHSYPNQRFLSNSFGSHTHSPPDWMIAGPNCDVTFWTLGFTLLHFSRPKCNIKASWEMLSGFRAFTQPQV